MPGPDDQKDNTQEQCQSESEQLAKLDAEEAESKTRTSEDHKAVARMLVERYVGALQRLARRE